MRAARLAVVVVAALAAARPAPAADAPVVVFQVKPVSKLLADLRAGAKLVGGDAAVGALNRSIEAAFGDRELAGVDPARPAVGYFVLGSKDGGPTVGAVVFAMPVVGEPEFLAFVERAGGSAVPVDGKPGLFRLTRPNVKPGGEPEHLRFHRKYAYFVQGGGVAAADADSLVPPDELVAADEPGMVAARFRLDRLSAATRAEFQKAIEKAVAEVKTLPVPDGAEGPLKRATEQLQATAVRWLSQAPDVRAAVVRVAFDAGTGEAGLEFALSPKPETGLARDVAGVAVDDPSKLEAEVRKLVANGLLAGADFTVQLDAAKVGGVAVYLVKPGAASVKEAAPICDPDARGGIAFAPNGIYWAFGPDPVKALGVAVKMEPKPARAFDVAVNPARVGKLAATVGGPGAAKEVGDIVGTADDTSSAVFATLEGGQELRARFGLNLKLFGKMVYRVGDARRAAPPAKDKDGAPPVSNP